MGRRHKERRVEQLPPISYFKPQGIPLRTIEEISLSIEEMEAIRLADLLLLDQSTAAESMDVSSPTFNRILASARSKIAKALWYGTALRIEGGNFRIDRSCQHRQRRFACRSCQHNWSHPFGTGHRGQDLQCPSCQSSDITRIE